MRAPRHDLITCQHPPPDTITLGGRVLTYKFGRTQSIMGQIPDPKQAQQAAVTRPGPLPADTAPCPSACPTGQVTDSSWDCHRPVNTVSGFCFAG